MEKNNGISDSRYKSRFFKKLAAWMGKHGAALTAVVLIAVSAILGCAEATIIYAAKGNEASNDYGTRGNTSSPSYIGGSGNNPTVYEPGVIGVSVVTYDLNEVSKKGTLYYGGKKDNENKKAALVASTNDPEVVKAVEAVAKELGSDGRILVRESGTEPLIRVMVEAATDEICAEQVKKVVDVIKAQGLCE